MDILDILLKPPQPFTGLFFIIYVYLCFGFYENKSIQIYFLVFLYQLCK